MHSLRRWDSLRDEPQIARGHPETVPHSKALFHAAIEMA